MKTFKEALKIMVKDGEFEKMINFSKGKEKSKIKEFYNAIKDFDDEVFDKMPEIVLIKACKSYFIWQDAYCYMRMDDYESKSTKKA
jgi:hypothetical protein